MAQLLSISQMVAQRRTAATAPIVNTEANLDALNPTLAAGQMARASDTGLTKYGPGQWGSLQSALQRGVPTNVLDYGADSTGTKDSYSAFVAAEAATSAGGVFWIPPGTYALSQKFRFNAYRSRFVGDGMIIPHSSNESGDYLIEFYNVGSDPLIYNLALNCQIDRVNVNGNFTNRGVYFGQIYNSEISSVRVWNAYGTGVCVDNCFENTWVAPLIANSKRRQASWVGSAVAWSSATSYSVGDYIYRDYAAYNHATSYTANNIVTYSGKLYRCAAPGTGHQPNTSPTYWQGIPFEYFRCEIAHTNKDPHAGGFTTNTSTAENRYWRQVYSEEAALEITCTYGAEVVDNEYFYGLQMRNNDHKCMIRVDNQQNQRKVTNVSFYGGQVHAIIQAYLDAFPSTGQTLMDDGVVFQFGHTMRCRIVGMTLRCAEASRVTIVQLGHINPDKYNEYNAVMLCDLSGEGSAQYGISVMPGVASGIGAIISDNQFSFTNSSTSPRQVGDTSRIVAKVTERDMVSATTPASFSASHYFRILDPSGNAYFVPCRSSVW